MTVWNFVISAKTKRKEHEDRPHALYLYTKSRHQIQKGFHFYYAVISGIR